MPRHRARASNRPLLAFCVAGGLVIALTGAALAMAPRGATIPEHIQPATAAAPASAPIEVPPAHRATPTPTPAAPAPVKAPTVPADPSSQGKLLIPAAGLSAPLLPLDVGNNGVVDPPSSGDAFILNGYGTPSESSSGTAFVAIHSSPYFKSDHALGSLLLDPDTGESKLPAGTSVFVDGVEYKVTGSLTAPKTKLADVKELWDGAHDLVLITCRNRDDGQKSTENTIVFADRA